MLEMHNPGEGNRSTPGLWAELLQLQSPDWANLLSSTFPHGKGCVIPMGSLNPPEPPYAGHGMQACLLVDRSSGQWTELLTSAPHQPGSWGWRPHEGPCETFPTTGAVVGLLAELVRLVLSERLAVQKEVS